MKKLFRSVVYLDAAKIKLAVLIVPSCQIQLGSLEHLSSNHQPQDLNKHSRNQTRDSGQFGILPPLLFYQRFHLKLYGMGALWARADIWNQASVMVGMAATTNYSPSWTFITPALIFHITFPEAVRKENSSISEKKWLVIFELVRVVQVLIFSHCLLVSLCLTHLSQGI